MNQGSFSNQTKPLVEVEVAALDWDQEVRKDSHMIAVIEWWVGGGCLRLGPRGKEG